jgi:hypothetical protein
MELDSARHESIRTYVCDGLLASDMYESVKLAPLYRGGADSVRDSIRIKTNDARASAVVKALKEAEQAKYANRLPKQQPHQPPLGGRGREGRGGGRLGGRLGGRGGRGRPQPAADFELAADQ